MTSSVLYRLVVLVPKDSAVSAEGDLMVLISRRVSADSGKAGRNLILKIFLISSAMFSAASSAEREDERVMRRTKPAEMISGLD